MERWTVMISWLIASSYLFLSLWDKREGVVYKQGGPLPHSPQPAHITWLRLVRISVVCDWSLASQLPLGVTTWAWNPSYRVYGCVPDVSVRVCGKGNAKITTRANTSQMGKYVAHRDEDAKEIQHTGTPAAFSYFIVYFSGRNGLGHFISIIFFKASSLPLNYFSFYNWFS